MDDKESMGEKVVEGAKAAAEKTAEMLVDAGLAVCAQVGADLVSFYRWDGAVKRDAQGGVIFKVLQDRFFGE